MNNQELIEFLNTENLAGTEAILRDSVKSTQEQLQNCLKNHSDLLATLKQKETEIIQLQGEIAGYIKIIEKRLAAKNDSNIEIT